MPEDLEPPAKRMRTQVASRLLRLPDDATSGRIVEVLGANAAALRAQQVTSLLRPLARAKRSRLLRKTLRSLEALGLRSNVVHRNLLLSALERLSHWQHALEELRDLRGEALEATAATMSTVSSACAKASEWQKALEVFGDTRRLSSELVMISFKDTICFNVAISACARGDRWITAVRLLREMQATEVQVDAISYNSAINACQWPMGLALLAEMKEVGLQADVVSYGAASWVSLRVGGRGWQPTNDDEPQSMRADTVAPDLVTVNAAIAACSLRGRWTGARFAADASIELSVTACNAAVSTCEKDAKGMRMANGMGMVDSADDQLHVSVVCSQRIQLQHDRISFYTAIHACESCGNWRGAQELLAEMNYQDGIQHLDAIANEHSCTAVVMRYLQSLRYFNRQKQAEGDQLRFYLGSSGLLNLWLRPQDKEPCLSDHPWLGRVLMFQVSNRGHCADLRLLQADSYRWLLDVNGTDAFGRGLVLLDPPYDSEPWRNDVWPMDGFVRDCMAMTRLLNSLLPNLVPKLDEFPIVWTLPSSTKVNSYHVWNLFIMKHIRQTWPLTSVALWYPIIDTSQTENFHTRLAELGEDVLVAEIEASGRVESVERPHEQQQSRAGKEAKICQHVLECELSALAQMLASSILADTVVTQ
eukprot:s587_g16.t1